MLCKYKTIYNIICCLYDTHSKANTKTVTNTVLQLLIIYKTILIYHETICFPRCCAVLALSRLCSRSTDIDECESSTPQCHAMATCQNTPGTFQCVCNEGYTGSGTECTGPHFDIPRVPFH